MVFVIYIFLLSCASVFGISDQRRCADVKCEEPISYGVAKLSYIPNEDERISVTKGDRIVVYSKDAGNDTSLWGVEVHGRRGYMPKSMVKEEKVIHKKLEYVVSTKSESSSLTNIPDSGVKEGSASAVPYISNSFSVVDGTTVYDDNITGEVLENQLIETVPINSQQSVDIQSSKTVDATNLSKNKLDEPNSSLILPQPTTSGAPVFSASTEEIFDETQAKVSKENKRSSVDTSELEKNEGEFFLDGKEFENNYNDGGNLGKHEIPVHSGVHNIDAIGTKDQEERGRKEGGEEVENKQGEEEDEEEEEEENKQDDVDKEGEETDELDETEMDEDDIEDNSKEGYELNGRNDESQGVVSVMSEEISDNSIISFKTQPILRSTENVLDKSEEYTSVNGESLESDLQNNLGGGEAVLKNNQPEVQTLVDTSTENSLVREPQQRFLGRADINNAEENSTVTDVGNNGSDDDVQIIEEYGKHESFVKTDSEKKTSTFTSSVLKDTNRAADDFASSSSDAYMDLNTPKTEILQHEDEERYKEAGINQLPSLGIFLGNKKIEDVDPKIKLNSEGIPVSSESNELHDVPIITGNIYTEQTSTIDLLKEIPHPYVPASTEEYIHVNGQDDDTKNGENLVSEEMSAERDEHENVNLDNDSKFEKNTIETSEESEVQGTCEMHSLGCMPESDSLPEQSSSEESEPGWFASFSKRPSLGSELVGTSTFSKEMPKNYFDTLLYLVVTAVTVLVFSLGYYYIEKQRRDGSFIAKINSLEKALMVLSQEKYALKDELNSAKEKLSASVASVDSGETWSILKEELEECITARSELEEHVASLEKELEAATEAGLELNRMMSELLSVQHGSDTLMKSVEHLQKQLDSQQSTISTMTANLTAKNLENENLQSELKLASQRLQGVEEQLAKALESKSADSQRLCRELNALQDVLDETRKTLTAREGEVSVLRECLSHAECLSNGGDSRISLEELLNVGHLRTKMDTLTKERDELQERLLGEEDARKLLEDHMKIVSEEVATLRAKYVEADSGKLEAQTRLEVLSNYFKEKETQLQKELGLQEAMYIQKEGDALSTIEQIKAFREEIENYKAQNEILKKEIVDQERSMKSQIAALEKKAHENWVAARQAERRMEESQQEASQLRNRLTMSGRRLVGTIPGPDGGKPPERGTLELEHNGEMSSSPAHVGETQELPSSPLHFGLPGSSPLIPPGGQPLPPGPFPGLPLFLPPGASGMPFPMPPPPGGLFPDDLRPPPLGRMSSPPPEPRGRFSPFEHSPPMSPPSRPYRSPPHFEDSPNRYRHQSPPSSRTLSFTGPFSPGKWEECGDAPRSSFRPLHRDSPREPKGSALSSGHSSESLDKGSRHSCV